MEFSLLGHRLTPEQRRMRQRGIFPLPFTLIDDRQQDQHLPSFLLAFDELLYGDLSRRLQIDKSILDYNYERMNKCLTIMRNERLQHRFLPSPASHYEYLPLQEYPIALEFYLQIDGLSSMALWSDG